MARPVREKRKIGRWILLILVLGLIGWKIVPSLFDSSNDTEIQIAQTEGMSGEIDAAVQDDENEEITQPEPVQENLANAITEDDEQTDTDSSDAAWWDPRPWLRRTFVVETIYINGALSVPEDTVRLSLDSVEGTPMIDVSLHEIAARIQHHPRIERAIVRRRLPKALVVQIYERREEALIVHDDDLFGLDADGVVMSMPPAGWPLDVPIITGFSGELVPGDTIGEPQLATALDWILEAGNLPRVSDWISEIHMVTDGIELIGGPGACRVIPGEHSAVLQVSALDAFLEERGSVFEPGSEIDLSFPKFLIVRNGSNG